MGSRPGQSFSDAALAAELANLTAAKDAANSGAARAEAAADTAEETAETISFDGAAAVRQARAPQWVDSAAKEDLLPTVPQATLDFYEVIERLLVDLSLDGAVGKRIGVYRVDHKVSGVSSVKFADLDAGTLAAQFYLASGDPPSLVTINPENSSGVSGTAEVDWSQLTAGLNSFTTIARALPLSMRALTKRTLVAEASAEAEEASADVATFGGRIQAAEDAAAELEPVTPLADAAGDLAADPDVVARMLDHVRGQAAPTRLRGSDALPTLATNHVLALARGYRATGTLSDAVTAGVQISDVLEGGQDSADPLPLLTGMLAIPAGAWSAISGGRYQATVTIDDTNSDKGLVQVWEVPSATNLSPSFDQYGRVDAAASVTAGTYHVDYSSGTGPGTHTVTITLQPTGAEDPTLGEAFFTYSHYRNPIRAGERALVSGLAAQGYVHENGLEGTGNVTIERAQFRRMPVHGVTIVDLTEQAVIRDCLGFEMVPATDSGKGRGFVYTIATPTAEDAVALFQRNVYAGFGMPSAAGDYTQDASRAFYTHAALAPGSPNPGLARVVGGLVADCDGGVYCVADRVEVEGLYVENVRSPLQPTTAELVTVGMVVRSDGSDNLAPVLPSGVSVGTWTMSEMHIRTGGIRPIQPPTGVALSVDRCTIDDTGGFGCVRAPSGLTALYSVFRSEGQAFNVTGTLISDYNLYLFLGTLTRWAVNGTTYTSLAALQAATGQDTHSVVLTGADAEAALDILDSGDARIRRAYVSGTDLSASGVGQRRPATRWPTVPTVSDFRRGDIFPLRHRYALAT
ncbi:hypothetical protein B1759_14935 [Rubrivirga sp. SAORIC476]|uniref:hypothetical protein n=1 Tax=Rubrivirga sp. SAORIC476 TaxID=1961794 RepID=UPI000BA9481A|nr:hypothetical protein [Rubrivirga sp. SAORIC476]PAP79613.1 hypothetical protein B1759_14935 [Rubrivirga sp. SAORIC476]